MHTMYRRRFLGGVGILVSSAAGGCLGDRPRSETATTNGKDGTNNGNTDGTNSDQRGFEPDVEPINRLGGTAVVSIEATPERDYEYLEDEDRVRIRYDSGRTNEMSFDEWGTRRATSAAADHVRTGLDDAGVLGDGVDVGVGVVELDDLDEGRSERAADPSEFDREVNLGPIVNHSRGYSREGELLYEPAVEFEAVVDATPRSVDVTMSFEEREYTAVLPVMCKKGWSRQD
jgi:hypothetical protein